ncbi:MAG TPA: type I-E CRISPR-associated protein Cse2/CasB, partial [Pseudonocardiaceae bacterium]|nr:type I-E CRISPR-associated protein Cse2/CasB [Pseudonocardiaceae bacterium]
MNDTRPHYWQRHTDGSGSWGNDGPAPGAELAALRRGIDREPGSVPAMWPFYTTLSASGALTTRLAAEHLALTLFAVHQQSLPQPVHRKGVGLGSAILELRNSGKFSPEAVDRRFAAAATATSLTELAHHLRGLIAQLRGVVPQ